MSFSNIKEAVFHLGLASLITHELDAMTHSEWRLLFVLRSLPEATASSLFVILHLPIIALLTWVISQRSDMLRAWGRMGISAFLIVHGVVHFYVSSNPIYGFHSFLSESLIFGAAALGAIYLALHAYTAKGESGH